MIPVNQAKKQKGMALIVVLWITAGLALLITSLNSIVRTSVVMAGGETISLQHDTLLDTGLEITAAKLIDENLERQWKPSDKIRKIRVGNRRLRIKVGDPNGLVDLNKTEKEVLANLFSQFTDRGKAQKLVDIIISLRPGKNQGRLPSVRGANRSVNQSGNRAAVTDHFIDISQFRRLSGVDNQLYKDLLPYLTVHSSDGKINPATAPAAVLGSIPGISRLQAEDIVRTRSTNGLDKQYLSNLRSRYGRVLSQVKSDVFIVTVTSPWQNTGKLVGKRYVIATQLDKTRPFNLLASRELR